ncbi:MAG: hypothetical protein GY868_12350 [Deltaproteobacteria bacterium]|nr:hypothetical protein [Deltaproteobacteria bacterium]
MVFHSIEHICQTFGLQESSPESLRRELRTRLKTVHPDRLSGPEPGTLEDQEEALRLTAALTFLDQTRRETAVMPVAEVTTLVQSLTEQSPRKKQQEAQARFEEQVKLDISQVLAAFKKASTVLASLGAALLVVWLFPGLTAGNPVLDRIIDIQNPVFNLIWFALLTYVCMSWVIISRVKNRAAASRTNLLLAQTRNRLFESFLRECAGQTPAATGVSFNKDRLISYLAENTLRMPRFASFFIGHSQPLKTALLESLADVMLTRALHKGLLHKENKKSLRDYYSLTIAARDL